jgi:hypothetical protein
MVAQPYLFYSYPWIAFPSRVIIYLREKGITSSLVTVVHVDYTQAGDSALPEFPPRTAGSLLILAIHSSDKPGTYIYIR